MEIPKSSTQLINAPKQQTEAKVPEYLQLLCPPEHQKTLETAIKNSGFDIHVDYPKVWINASGVIVFFIYELNVLFDRTDDKQFELMNLQDKLMGFNKVAQTGD